MDLNLYCLNFGIILFIRLQRSMIKKCTPSKNFLRDTREDSCCGFCLDGADRRERALEITPKLFARERLQKPTKSPFRLTPRDISDRSGSNTSLNSPASSLLPSQTRSRTKTLLQTAATIDCGPFGDSSLELPLQATSCNPLVRLRQRLFRNPSARDHAVPPTTPGRISFSYFPGEGGTGLAGTVSLGGLQPVLSEQPQPLEAGLRREIEEFRAEYGRLLREEEGLRAEREGNRACYMQLLELIREKEAELRELERMRREEVAALRAELEEFIAVRAEEE